MEGEGRSGLRGGGRKGEAERRSEKKEKGDGTNKKRQENQEKK